MGQGIEAGDLITRTLNYLSNKSNKSLHHKILAKAIEAGKLNTDSPQNLFALYWIEQPEATKPLMNISAENVLTKLSLLFGEDADKEDSSIKNEGGEGKSKSKTKAKPSGELSQLESMTPLDWARAGIET